MIRTSKAKNIRIGSIVIDCDDFDKMASFWRDALYYKYREPPEDGWVVLTDPEVKGPNVSINRSSEGHLDQYRLHLDLYTDDQEGEVKRLVGLGMPAAVGDNRHPLTVPNLEQARLCWNF